MSLGSIVAAMLAIALIILWIVAGGYITQANVKLTDYKDSDSNLSRAYWSTFWGAFITWTLVGIGLILGVLAILGGIALFVTGIGEVTVAAASLGGPSLVTKTASATTVVAIIIAGALTTLTGILGAIGAVNIKKSNHDGTDDLDKAHKDCVTAATMCLVAVSLIIILAISYFVSIHIKNKKLKKRYEEYLKAVDLANEAKINAEAS